MIGTYEQCQWELFWRQYIGVSRMGRQTDASSGLSRAPRKLQ